MLNILLLMFVALVPFPTAYAGLYGMVRVTAVLYGANLLVLFLTAWMLYAYTISRHGRAKLELARDLARRGWAMGLVPGANDVRHLSPGVYFCRRTAGPASGGCAASVVRKVIVQ